MNKLEKNQMVYFYYSSIIPCHLGRVAEVMDSGYEVQWLTNDGKPCGTSTVPEHLAFNSKEACLGYVEKLRTERRKELVKQLNTPANVLNYMYSSIYSEDYDLTTEKDVIRDKVLSLFGITIDTP